MQMTMIFHGLFLFLEIKNQSFFKLWLTPIKIKPN